MTIWPLLCTSWLAGWAELLPPPGQVGKALGTPPGINPLNLPLRPAQPPGKVPPPPHPPVAPAKVLPRKNLTLSGSLTFPTNLWPQHKGLFWLKGPTLWDSHHHLSARFSVIQTLSHRASIVCSNPELLQKEKQHLRKALTKCNYPKWALDKVEKRLNRSTRQVNDGGNNSAQPANHEVQSKGHIVIPYTQGLCESIKKICGRYGIQTHFKGGKTIKNLLVSPKDKDPILNQSGAIYRYQCNNLGCDDEYIGETSRTFGERYKEHLKAPSAIHHHSTITGHSTNHNNFQIIGREGHNLARNIKESIYIRVNNPSLNNNIGKFNLSHIWDRVLLNTKGLTLK